MPVAKKDLATVISKKLRLSQKDSLSILESLINFFHSNTDNITNIHNFGTFKMNNKKSRIGRNPKTKEEYNISSRNVITFKASKILLKNINIKFSD